MGRENTARGRCYLGKGMPETRPINRSSRLAGHSVIVTGGTRDVGWVFTRTLTSTGVNVVVTGGSSQADLNRSQQRATSIANAGQLHAMAADVRGIDNCMRVAAATIDKFGGITGLINTQASQCGAQSHQRVAGIVRREGK